MVLILSENMVYLRKGIYPQVLGERIMTKNLALSYDFSAIDNADLADSTKEKYRKAIMNYLATGNKLGDIQAISEYSHSLSQSGRSFLKAAIRLMTTGMAKELKSNATPENIDQVQASLYRLEAIDQAIQVKKVEGKKAHFWLTQAKVREIMATCGDDIVGQRDWIVLALLVGAGLRREELINLTFDNLKEVPRRNGNGGMRPILEVKGKGAKNRVIPIKQVLADRIREWHSIVGNGFIARSLGRSKEIGDSLSAVGVFNIVRKHGKAIKYDKLAPHDMRRTYAQLGFEAGIPITQISVLLGHSNIGITQKYLDLEIDVDMTISDFIPLNGD